MRNISVLYACLRPLVNSACRLFYRNLHVRDSNQVSGKKAPIILISNHQNALLDPLLCCISSPEQLNFLTRADVFKNSIAKKVLFSLNMLPVYRPHDKVNILESNAPTFQESLKRLEKNQIMSLFPEGTHDRAQNLMPFKKGAARLICDVFASGKKDKIIIQPVGLHYTNIMHSGYPCFVKFGEQVEIRAKDLDLTPEMRSRTVLELTRKMRAILQEYVIHISLDDDYEKKLFIFRALQWRNLFSKQKSSIPEFKKLEAELDNHISHVNHFSEKELEDIEYSSFDSGALVLAASKELKKRFSIKLLMLLPIYFLGAVSTFIPFQIGKFLSKKLVKDVHFTSTVKIVSGFIFIPIFWMFCFGIFTWLINLKWSFVLTLGLVLSGCIFIKYHTSYRILARANSIKDSSKYQPFIAAIKRILS